MTTASVAALYIAQHNHVWADKVYAVFNPQNRLLDELPTVYGFNNGGSHGMLSAVLLAEDGTHLGGHGCSAESYMHHDLGILEGSRPDRHETFQKHYPAGYKMDFVGADEVETHAGLNAAYEANQASRPDTSEKD
jgi:hypothetical protein